MTWGRLFDAVDPDSLLDAVKPHLRQFELQNFSDIFLCYTLSEASDQPYFYGSLFNFSRNAMPHIKGYKKWCKEKKRNILGGKDISYLGDKRKFDR